jgi:hypothetical protein
VAFDTSRVKKLITVYPKEGMTDPKVHANPSNYARFYFHELFPKYVARGPHTSTVLCVARLRVWRASSP